jgi:hypothetical protein
MISVAMCGWEWDLARVAFAHCELLVCFSGFDLPISEINAAVYDFLQERWKGLLPILWGQQLRQERFTEFIYLNILNAQRLPGIKATPLAADLYALPTHNDHIFPFSPQDDIIIAEKISSKTISYNRPVDTLVIGGGLSGLMTAWQIARSGQRISLITKGWGSTHWQTGCVDVLGYSPIEIDNPVESPVVSILQLVKQNLEHPYSRIEPAGIQTAVSALIELSQELGYPLHGNLQTNWLLPTGLGAIR